MGGASDLALTQLALYEDAIYEVERASEREDAVALRRLGRRAGSWTYRGHVQLIV